MLVSRCQGRLPLVVARRRASIKNEWPRRYLARPAIFELAQA
jgi:hypothetical protein